jgi:hypothetical protein
MSRTRFWTILLGSEPTAFRAREQAALVPTLKQLQRRHPEAVLRWFERGRLFASPEEAREVFRREQAETRPKDWRPGGQHRDPKARYARTRAEKRRAFKLRLRRDRRAPAAPPGGAGGPAPERPARSKRRPSKPR